MRIGVIGRGGPGWLADVLATARRVDEASLDTFWVNQAFSVDPLTALTVAAPLARGVELGTAVIPIFTRHPQALAAQALTTQTACEGRLTLGIGLSHRHVVEGRWGRSFERPAEHMRQYLDALLPLLRGECPEVRGSLVTSTGGLETGGTVKPPSVLLGALGPAMLRMAGSLADGTITAGCGPRTLAQHVVPEVSKAAESAGRPSPRIVACFSLAVTSDQRRAEELRAAGAAHLRSFPSFRAMLEREGEGGDTAVSIIGTEEQAHESIARVKEAGATDLALFVGSGGSGERERTWSFLRAVAAGGTGG
jgi:F420-dependent oxidoreductase-like protein